MKELKKVIAKVLRVSPKKISEETTPNDVKGWDSLRNLLLITELENNYQIKFTLQDILSIKRIRDIKECLKRYGIKIKED